MSQFPEDRKVHVTLKNNVGSSERSATREIIVRASSPMEAVEKAERAVLDQLEFSVRPIRFERRMPK